MHFDGALDVFGTNMRAPNKIDAFIWEGIDYITSHIDGGRLRQLIRYGHLRVYFVENRKHLIRDGLMNGIGFNCNEEMTVIMAPDSGYKDVVEIRENNISGNVAIRVKYSFPKQLQYRAAKALYEMARNGRGKIVHVYFKLHQNRKYYLHMPCRVEPMPDQTVSLWWDLHGFRNGSGDVAWNARKLSTQQLKSAARTCGVWHQLE
jgi:hypothetical protein